MLLLALVLGGSGCAILEVTNRSVGYNVALENAANELILLNAVRASKRYPMYFTAISKFSASAPVSGEVGFTLPFTGPASGNLVSPKITVSSGTGFDVGILNTQEFYRGILNPLPGSMLDYYFRQGWAQELLLHMFIREIRVEEMLVKRLIVEARAECDEPDTKHKGLCQAIGKATTAGQPCAAEIDDVKKPFVNQPGDTCQFLRFQTFWRRARVLDDIHIVTVVRPTWLTSKYTVAKDGSTEELECKTVVEYRLVLPQRRVPKEQRPQLLLGGLGPLPKAGGPRDAPSTSPGLGGPPASQPCERQKPSEKVPTTVSTPKEVPPAAVFLRSPEAMIFYLGELIEIATRPTPSVPVVFEGPDDRPKSIFLVRKGLSTADGALVSVRHDGESYYIPRVSHTEDESMHVLSLVTQILYSQQHVSDLPITPTLRIIPQ